MDYSPPGSSSVPGVFLSKNNGAGCHFSSPGDLSDPVIELRSPALQADSLPSEPPGNPQDIYTHTQSALIS